MTSFHRAVAALAAAFLFLGTPLALAHEEASLDALAVLVDVRPTIEMMEVQVFQLTAPVIVLSNLDSRSVIVIGETGEPFLRIGPAGVETNVRSPTSYRAADPSGERPLPAGLDPSARPEWITLSRETTWSWFDPRAVYSPSSPEWTIPLRVGRHVGTIFGSFEPIDGHGHFATRLVDPVTVDGLTLRLFDASVPAIFVRNTTQEILQVPGRSGEPFLRIGPRGTFGNVLSPDYYASGSQTVRDIPPGADPAAEPRWKRLSAEPVWQWLEYRARLPASAHQRADLGNKRKTVLSWTTPLRLGSDELKLTGQVEWLPPRMVAHQDRRGVWLGALLATVAFSAAFVYLARLWQRRKRKAGPPN